MDIPTDGDPNAGFLDVYIVKGGQAVFSGSLGLFSSSRIPGLMRTSYQTKYLLLSR